MRERKEIFFKCLPGLRTYIQISTRKQLSVHVFASGNAFNMVYQRANGTFADGPQLEFNTNQTGTLEGLAALSLSYSGNFDGKSFKN